METLFSGVYRPDARTIATRNIVPGIMVYGEKLVKSAEGELRVWDPYRSKLCAAMKKGLKNFPFAPGSRLLYLGASTGTTISHHGAPGRNLRH
jgi:fibrillarin-like pre-rRNA processing protein